MLCSGPLMICTSTLYHLRLAVIGRGRGRGHEQSRGTSEPVLLIPSGLRGPRAFLHLPIWDAVIWSGVVCLAAEPRDLSMSGGRPTWLSASADRFGWGFFCFVVVLMSWHQRDGAANDGGLWVSVCCRRYLFFFFGPICLLVLRVAGDPVAYRCHLEVCCRLCPRCLSVSLFDLT